MSQKAGKPKNKILSSSESKLLVICVDRDNDVGEKNWNFNTCCWQGCMY